MAQHVFKLVFTCLWLLLLAQELCNAAPATQQAIQNTSTTTVRPITDQIKASASNEEADDADVKPVPPTTGNGNVYGAANAGNSGGGGGGGGEAGGTQSNRPSNRGYNQGYSYNTGIKPYRTGYTYFQPFGDAADQQNQDQSGNSSGSKGGGGGGGGGKASGNADNSQQQVPVEISNMLGIDPKQFGPVKVIPNQNVPVDENGIPNLDAIKIPENNQQQQQVQVQPRMRPVAAPVRPVAQPQVPVNPSDFSMGNDFNLNQILGSGNGAARPRPVQQQQQYNPANDNSMFDFAPPSNQNFNFDNQNNGGGGARDYNRLDNFAGNLNNFDTYLGDAGLMMDNDNNNNGGANNGGGGDNSGLADFMGGGGGGGGQQQQVPSEIVNLNNAFGSNTNQQNNNDMMSILSQMNDNGNGGGGGNQAGGTNGMDFGNFGNAATNQNQFFPSFF